MVQLWRICQCRRLWFNPWSRKIPWRRKWQPTPIFLPGKSHGQSSLVGYSPWGHKRVRYEWTTTNEYHSTTNRPLLCMFSSISISLSTYIQWTWPCAKLREDIWNNLLPSLTRACRDLMFIHILRYQGKQVASKKYKQRGVGKGGSQEIAEKGDNAHSTKSSRSPW